MSCSTTDFSPLAGPEGAYYLGEQKIFLLIVHFLIFFYDIILSYTHVIAMILTI